MGSGSRGARARRRLIAAGLAAVVAASVVDRELRVPDGSELADPSPLTVQA